MANYYSWGRSNYFRVKDPAAFETWCEKWDEGERGGENDEFYVLTFDSIPTLCFTAEGDADSLDTNAEEWVEADFVGELAEHLADGWVAILMEVGHERLRYLTGFAIAVNSSGETVTVDICSIYKWAEQLGQHVTRAQY